MRIKWVPVLCVFTFFVLAARAQEPDVKVNHLNVDDGLSHNWVRSIIKDSHGFMWFGTFNGLNRYDGKNLKVYKLDDENQPGVNFIESLAEDAKGTIWVGTFSGGLYAFDRRSEKLQRFRHDPEDRKSISGNKVHCLFHDKSGNLWIGTEKGLDKYDYTTKAFIHFVHNPDNDESIPEGSVTAVFQDHSGNLWIGTDRGGVASSDGSKQIFRRLAETPEDDETGDDYVKSFFEDRYGKIWIGTWGGGLKIFDRHGKTFEVLTTENSAITNNSVIAVTGDNEENIFIATEGGGLNIFNTQSKAVQILQWDLENSRSLQSNSLHSLLFDDESGILWIGTYNAGVGYFSKWEKPFKHVAASKNGLGDKNVTCITEDLDGNLWIGTDGGGVTVVDNTGGYRYFKHEKQNSNSLLSNAVLSILCDRNNKIWVGTFNGGLDHIDPNSNKITHYKYNPKDSKSLAGQHASALYEDKHGTLWVGTMTGGLQMLDQERKEFKLYKHNPNDSTTILDDFIIGICEDSQGGLLIQTGKGLEAFDYRTRTFRRFGQSARQDVGVTSAVLEDTKGNLWVGTRDSGLRKVTRPAGHITTYTVEDGLPSNGISAIVEDNTGSLWISTQRGLCKFEHAIHHDEGLPQFQIYSVEDGLQGSEFKAGAYCKRKNGNLLFGGQNGYNEFDPSAIKANPFVAPVKITGFKVLNKEVKFGPKEILTAPITETPAITLSHHESVFTFEFTALNYTHPNKNQYAYKMEGFDHDWNFVKNQTSATYTNLDPGDYVFKVRASNNDGVWNPMEASIILTVLPPWWNTAWFRITVAFLTVILVVAYFRLRTGQLKARKEELEHQVRIRTADLQRANSIIEERHREIGEQNTALLEKNDELERQSVEIKRMSKEIKELSEAKVRFFTNISHELRTPLNLIIWPLEEMMRKNEEEHLYDKYSLMHKNASRLTRLINQLLDFRKVETGTLRLNKECKNIVPSIREVFDSFKDWAQRSRIHYIFESHFSSIEVDFDEDKIEKILSNLLSNSFKNVAEGGVVKVCLSLYHNSEPDERLAIMVYDNGVGIPEEKIPFIFNPFYEGKPSKIPGSGIGLALVKELVELHEGNISVTSKINEGTTFAVDLPVTRTSLRHEILDEKVTVQELEFDVDSSEPLFVSPRGTVETLPILLIIDDNEDVTAYLSKRLSDTYQVETATNGRMGIARAVEVLPDLIITDVMMPEVDGFEVCRCLKADERTSHIPIIQVTARSGDDAQLLGLSVGADDYITKPFKLDILQYKVRNILFTRDKLKEQFKRNPYFPSEATHVSSADENFLKTAVTIIEKNLDNSDFGVESFSEHFNMSRRNVLRKIKALTGMSISEFIKNIRLKEAYRLLQRGELNVGEIAYTVGFNDQKYFSKCFKEQFGKLPSEVE